MSRILDKFFRKIRILISGFGGKEILGERNSMYKSKGKEKCSLWKIVSKVEFLFIE